MNHYRAVVHIAVKDEEEAKKVAERIDRLWFSVDPEAPYVTVLSLERRARAPGKRGWR